MFNPDYSDRDNGQTSSPLMIIPVLLLLLVTLVAIAVVLRDPMAEFAEKRRIDAETKKLEVQQKLEQESLRQDVEVLIYSVGNKLADLNRRLDELSIRFETVTGIPFASAHEYTSRRIDQAVLRSYSFAETWSRLLNARVSYDKLLDQEYRFSRIRDRYESDQVTRLDRVMLLELADWVRRQELALPTQHQRISEISVEAGAGLVAREMFINSKESENVTENN